MPLGEELLFLSTRRGLAPANRKADFCCARTSTTPQFIATMKAAVLAATLMITCFQGTWAADAPAALAVESDDSIKAVLERQVGQSVEVRLKSGDKLAGKVAIVGDKVLHLSMLVGQEFYDAVIDVKDVSAIVVRVRRK